MVDHGRGASGGSRRADQRTRRRGGAGLCRDSSLLRLAQLPKSRRISRRDFARSALAAATAKTVGLGTARAAPAISWGKHRPVAAQGVASGDLSIGQAVVWCRSDRPARVLVEYSTSPTLLNAHRIEGPPASALSDYTVRVSLRDLPHDQTVFYRITLVHPEHRRARSEPVEGRLRPVPYERRDLRFCWSGDTVGQGWGINPAWGGMKCYASLHRQQPDFFVHAGDSIYADSPLKKSVEIAPGQIWNNIVTPAKSKVAETLEDFRGNYRYNFIDHNLRQLYAETPLFAIWDDHEIRNNWFPGQRIRDPRYRAREINVLAARSRQAFFEYLPAHPQRFAQQRLLNVLNYGPSLSVFFLDLRSFRGPNSSNRQARPGTGTAILGKHQLDWLKRALLECRATWKVLVSSLPIGLVVEVRGIQDGIASGSDGPPRGREMELASLLSFIKRHGIRNTVWLSADIHYASAQHYHPDRARFRDFLPFWEFSAGPIHAGTFPAKRVDSTFGPEVLFQSVPPGMRMNRPPTDGLQFFGTIDISGTDESLTARLQDLEARVLFEQRIAPQRH